MKPYGVNELRRMFLEFFRSKEHLVHESYSLIPHNDNSLLLINAGMAPLKPYFTGQEVPPKTRMATCQKCVRTGDIDNVGRTARHLTFFEMLGNFSFGDYFKKESLQWSWEFLTKVVGLDPDRLYPSVYGEDDEAFSIWTDVIGVPAEKIKRFYRDENGDCDNFWEHGAGPCGPCSEIYYDRGEAYGCDRADCGVGCDCDRYMEVWNNVFTQFEGDGHGHYTELENKNIDTGMGLERLAVVVQDVDSVFDIDTMKAIRDRVCALSGTTYQANEKLDISIRLITDHIRSAVFMIADGITPSNAGRGYVLRRLIRRAARHGRLLGIGDLFLGNLCKTVIAECEDGYPELREREELIVKVLTLEEEQFQKTIDSGLQILSEMIKNAKEHMDKVLSGEQVFKLYDTYGFPKDLTEEILAESDLLADEEGFVRAMEQQRERARSARKETNYMGAEATAFDTLDASITTSFVGYSDLEAVSPVVFMTIEKEADQKKYMEPCDELTEGFSGVLLTEETPFYGEMGGQTGDTGEILTSDGIFVVEDTKHLPGGRIGHFGYVKEGRIAAGDMVTLSVDAHRRRLIARNHTATHLLQKALQTVLGTHVQQKGSDVNEKRLRFDFSHFSAMTSEEIRSVEALVNRKIQDALDVTTQIMTLEEAKKTGAMALFGEKYGEEVRVVRIGDFSTELCGGTHMNNTEGIGAFKIVTETGIASGVRRIEALTSQALFEHFYQIEDVMHRVAGIVKSDPAGVLNRISQVMEQSKQMRSEIESFKSKEAQAALGDVSGAIEEVGGMRLLCRQLKDVEGGALRDLGDQMKETIGEGVVVLASDNGGKVALMITATDGAVKAGAHAGNLIRAAAAKVGGGGGGRPNMAQAGGRNPEGIPDAFDAVREVLAMQLER